LLFNSIPSIDDPSLLKMSGSSKNAESY